MSKRVTLTDFEIKQIISGLTQLRNQSNGAYAVTQVGRRWYDALIEKLTKDPMTVDAKEKDV